MAWNFVIVEKAIKLKQDYSTVTIMSEKFITNFINFIIKLIRNYKSLLFIYLLKGKNLVAIKSPLIKSNFFQYW
jgi:hypothetical protein